MRDIHYRIKIDDGDLKAEFYENGISHPVVKINGSLSQKEIRKQLEKALNKYGSKVAENTKEIVSLAKDLEERFNKGKDFSDWLK